MLAIKHVGNRDMPVVLCDYCEDEITDAKEGNYQWWVCQAEQEGALRAVFFTHKRCCHAFEAQRRPMAEGGIWCAMELQALPIYLGNNLKLRWRKARELARMMACLG